MNVQRVPVALFGPASPSECPTESHAHKHALKLLPKATSKFGQVHSPQRLSSSTAMGRTQWRSAGPRPRAPGHPLAPPLPQRVQRLVHHAARPDLRPRLLNAASPCAQLRRRRRTLGDGAVPCSNRTRGQKGFSCRASLAVYRGTGCGSHERHRSCRRRACRRPSPCRSRGVRSEARRRLCCPCAPPDARGLQDIGMSK